MCIVIYSKFSCRICAKNMHDKDKAAQWELCEFWIHIKCNNLNYLDYTYLQNCDESWYCIECRSSVFPFNSLSSNKNFLACCSSADSDSNFRQLKKLENDHNSSLLLKLSPNKTVNKTVNNLNKTVLPLKRIMTLKTFFHPNILTSMKCHSNTLIGNIFSNVHEPEKTLGNLKVTISDHQPQFAIIPTIFIIFTKGSG